MVGFLAAVAAVCLGAISRGGIELDQAAVLCASSITTAFVAALSLGKWLPLEVYFVLLIELNKTKQSLQCFLIIFWLETYFQFAKL